MHIVHSLIEIPHDPNSVVTVGMFDGVHRAHQQILRELLKRSRARRGRSVVITFDPHPKEVLGGRGSGLKLLTTLGERVALIKEYGIDFLYVINFTWEFSRLAAEEFYRSYIIDGIGVSEVVVGYDHMFGKDRSAGLADLQAMGQKYSFSVVSIPALSVDGEVVSSTKIRKALFAGDVIKASAMLGRPYNLSGEVIRGDGRGKSLGIPTANLRPLSPEKLIPANGIYFVRVKSSRWISYGMLSIGTRPTFSTDDTQTIEVHVFGINEDLYGELLSVEFIQRLRDERKFDSPEELVQQIRKDQEQCEVLLKQMETTEKSFSNSN